MPWNPWRWFMSGFPAHWLRPWWFYRPQRSLPWHRGNGNRCPVSVSSPASKHSRSKAWNFSWRDAKLRLEKAKDGVCGEPQLPQTVMFPRERSMLQNGESFPVVGERE